jgi:hypothetical protein
MMQFNTLKENLSVGEKHDSYRRDILFLSSDVSWIQLGALEGKTLRSAP